VNRIYISCVLLTVFRWVHLPDKALCHCRESGRGSSGQLLAIT